MAITPMHPYLPQYRPLSNITPFTYRDGLTYAKKLEGLQAHIIKLVEYVNASIAELDTNIESDINQLIENFNSMVVTLVDEVDNSISDNNTLIDNKIDTLNSQFDSIVDQIIGASIEVSEPIVTALIADEESGPRQVLDETYAPVAEGQTTIRGQYNFTADGFTKPYDTDIWIAGPIRMNPTLNSQGLYIQHRVGGDLGTLVNDAAASELRLTRASNTGAGQAAHEFSLVVNGENSDINNLYGVLANFHTEPGATGNIKSASMIRAQQARQLQPGFNIERVIGLEVDNQYAGDVNYSIFAPDGRSVFGRHVAKDVDTTTTRITGLLDQNARLLLVEKSDGVMLAGIRSDGTVNVGPDLPDSVLGVANSVNGGGNKTVLKVRAHGAQEAPIAEFMTSDNVAKIQVGSTGNLLVVGTSFLMRNPTNTGTVVSITPTGFRWNEPSLAQAGVGAAGSASPLPASPAKYLRVLDSDGTVLVIPAFARV